MSEGVQFEDDIREFLRNCGFENVPRYGPSREVLELGGHEVDAFGRFDDLYVVIDAKTASSLRGRREGIQTQLDLIGGYKERVIEGIRQQYESTYGYHDCIFILWTKNKKIQDRHRDLARGHNIALRDEFDLDHYSRALAILQNPDLVRNSFLKDISLQMGINVFRQSPPIPVDAIRTRVGGKKFYTFLIKVKHLLKFAYVFRIETNNILASYQRLLNPHKIRRIRSYLGRQGFFANNILAVTDENLQFDDNERQAIWTGTLNLPDKPCYLEILDGQHRLLAYASLPRFQDHCLSVTVISDLTPIERAKLFVIVNREQTKVPSYLLWDLYTIIEPDRLRGKISKFVQQLNEDGPFKDLIRLPRVRSPRAYLSFTNLCQSFYNRTGLYSRFGENPSFVDVVKSFFRVVKEDHPLGEDWVRSVEGKGRRGFICTNNAISIQIYVLSRILRKREEDGLAFPSPPSEINTWRAFLQDQVVGQFRQYLTDRRDADNPRDPFGFLRKETSNEGQRTEAATRIFESISFES